MESDEDFLNLGEIWSNNTIIIPEQKCFMQLHTGHFLKDREGKNECTSNMHPRPETLS